MLVSDPPVVLDANDFENVLHVNAYEDMLYRMRKPLGQRYVPQFAVQYFARPAAANTSGFVNAKALPASSEEWVPGVTSGVTAYAIDYAQTLRFVCSGAQTGNIVVHGTDILNEEIEEQVTLNGTTAVHTKKAFKTVSKFVVPAKAGSETITIGTHATTSVGRYGLIAKLIEPMVILCETVTGVTTLPAQGYWVHADTSATPTSGGDQRGLWRPSVAPDGDKSFCIVYLPT